jgi:DEAD/H associated
MLLTRCLERARFFVANEYALAVWGLGDIAARISKGELSLAALFDEDMLGNDLEAWLAESALMKRTFRNCAIIAGLIERRFPGQEKSRRQLTISTFATAPLSPCSVRCRLPRICSAPDGFTPFLQRAACRIEFRLKLSSSLNSARRALHSWSAASSLARAQRRPTRPAVL